MNPRNPIKFFISYSHQDESLKNELVEYLSSLKREGRISIWDDQAIDAGKEWKNEIDQQLQSAQVILLLISHRFINSDFCHDVEMGNALERHKAGDAIVIPTIISDCDWKNVEVGEIKLGDIKALPKDGKPVKDWSNPENAFADIARGIRKVVEKIPQNP
jgi:hypothetical protein